MGLDDTFTDELGERVGVGVDVTVADWLGEGVGEYDGNIVCDGVDVIFGVVINVLVGVAIGETVAEAVGRVSSDLLNYPMRGCIYGSP